MSMLIAVFWLVVLAYLARWVFSSVDRGNPEIAARHETELARLREEVDLLASQVRRLSEEQSFMVHLLSEGEKFPELAAPREESPPDIPNQETP